MACISLGPSSIPKSKTPGERRFVLNYEDALPTILKELFEDPELADISVVLKRLEKAVNYNAKDVLTKRTLSRIFLSMYQSLKGACTEQDMQLAFVLVWCLEIFESCSMVADDICDKGTTRRGAPCWYLMEDVGDHAVNDVLLLENVVYQILTKYFKGRDCYVELMELFHRTIYKAALGQSLDIEMSKKQDHRSYNLEEYFVSIKYKSGHLFSFPIQLAFIYAGKSSEYQPFVQGVILQLGMFLQIWNDYAAVFGDFESQKNVSTDIVEGKCTWLFLTAKEMILHNKESKELVQLYENYGVDDVNKVRWVEELYRRLELDHMFAELRDETKDSLNETVNKIADSAARKALEFMVVIAFEKVERN